MSDKTKNTAVAAESNTAKPQTQTAESKFKLFKLRENCVQLFGVSDSTFAGASCGLAKDEYTISEMKNIINTWLKKEAK